ncbi:MAG: hypothetical protein ACK4UQ_00840 [Brevundimonas sp.]
MSEGIGGYLRADEKVLWRGRPQQGIRFVGQDVFMVPLSLLWAGGVVAIFSVGGGEITGMGFPFMLFPLIFGVAAFYITIGRLIHDAWIRSNIEYALTDRRIVILKTGLGSDLTTLDIGRLDQISFKPRGDRGDILFGPAQSFFGFGGRSFRNSFSLWTPSLSETPQFIGVENGRRLFDQIEGLRAQARR